MGDGLWVQVDIVLAVTLQPREEIRVIDEAVFSDFGIAREAFAFRQCLKECRVSKDKFGVVERPNHIFALGRIHSSFAAD